MKDFLTILAAVTIGVFVALIVWTLIVKDQVSGGLSNTPLNSLLSLFGGNRGAAGT